MTPNIRYSKSKFGKLMVPYPEKPVYFEDSKVYNRIQDNKYNEAVAASFASALEFVEEDQDRVKKLAMVSNYEYTELKDGQLFMVEGIETEELYQEWSNDTKKWIKSTKGIFNQEKNHAFKVRQVVRLKAKLERDYGKEPVEIIKERIQELRTTKRKFDYAAFERELKLEDSAPPEPKGEWRVEGSWKSLAGQLAEVLKFDRDASSFEDRMEAIKRKIYILEWYESIADKLNQSTMKE